MYENKKRAYRLAVECGENFTSLSESDKFIQENFLFDPSVVYPVHLQNTTINSMIDNTLDIDFYSLRRKGLLKNKILTGDIYASTA